MSGWFGNISLGVNFPIPVSVNPSPSGSPYGAQWSKTGRNVTLAINQGTKPQEFVRSLMVAEVTEMFMDAQKVLGAFRGDNARRERYRRAHKNTCVDMRFTERRRCGGKRPESARGNTRQSRVLHTPPRALTRDDRGDFA